jgi:guanylate kinase
MSNDERRSNESESLSDKGHASMCESAARGKLIVVCAPSGAGKSSLVGLALQKIERLRFSVSYTTRGPRGAEQHGVNYFFISSDEFRSMRNRNEFLECAEVHGNLYGTHRAHVVEMLKEGNDVILDIDVQGAEQIRASMDEAVTVFIMPPSFAALEQRLRNRNLNHSEDLERRLRNATQEVRLWDRFDYVIVNDDLHRAYLALEAIIYAERCRPDRKREQVDKILDTFEGESLNA